MKLFNTHSRQTFHYDYTDPVTSVVTKFVLVPQKAKEVPEEVGRKLLKDFPKHFTADEEAMDLRAESKKQLADRDQVIADLTKRCLEAETRADKAEAALEVFAANAEREALATKDPLGVTGLAEVAKSAETAEPAAPAAEATKRKKGPPKAAMPVTDKP